mgnify:FL=1
MKIYKHEDVEKYLENDWILEWIKQYEKEEEKAIRTHQWMLEMENKRAIYADVYGDILRADIDLNKEVLDVVGGYNALTKLLANNCRYTLIDFMAHGGKAYLECSGGVEWYCGSWYAHQIEKDYDIVIANDIFPDVDQRMEMFLDKYLPHCQELRLVVTFYNKPQFYEAKRVDDSEILTFLSWDGEITGIKLRKYLDRMMDTGENDLSGLKDNYESIFRNGRQVGYIRLKGDL